MHLCRVAFVAYAVLVFCYVKQSEQTATRYPLCPHKLWGTWLNVLIVPSSRHVLECSVHGQQLRCSARQANTHTLQALTSLRSFCVRLLDAVMQSMADVDHFSYDTI